MQTLRGKRIAFMVANQGVEELELTTPWRAALGAGAQVELIAPLRGRVQAYNDLARADVFLADRSTAEADVADYDALVLPGGVASSDRLRMNYAAVELVRSFFAAAKPVAAICHGPWSLVEADVVRGRTVTSWPSLHIDLVNAGARWVDTEVCVDNMLVTARKPADLPAFCPMMIEVFSWPTGSRSWAGGSKDAGLAQRRLLQPALLPQPA